MPRVVPSQVVELIDRLFPWAATQLETNQERLSSSQAAQMVAVADLVDRVPSELITVGWDDYSAMVVSVAALRITVQRWHRLGQGTGDLTLIKGFGTLNPVTLIRRALAGCPDEAPLAATSELAFIGDQDLRGEFQKDLNAVNEALRNGGWKAATVLGGALVEALLLWALQQEPPATVQAAISTAVAGRHLTAAPPSNLESWVLHQYVEVAGETGVIEADTRIQARQAKDYRNLIHPGRAARLARVCDRGTALAAVAAVELVVRDLTP